MGLEIEDRPSDSPYIQRVWRSRSHDVDRMTSIATPYWDLVVWEQSGQVSMAVQGPESKASPAPVPEDASFFGISFSLGTVLPHAPPGRLVDSFVDIPEATRGSFWLNGSTWQVPDYDNAEEFVGRMVRDGVLVRDPIVAEVLRGAWPNASLRTVQRRFVAVTGLTRTAIRQIERAREAAVLIREGLPVHDVVHRLGYFDQPHLAHSLARYVGRSSTQLRDREPAEPLSLLYKT
jgi:hypothetical protein